LKCPPITSVGVSANRKNNSRRIAADWTGSDIGGRMTIEMRHLAGMMGDIAGKQALFAIPIGC